MSIFEEAADTYGVDVNLLTAIAKQESNFTADATSSSGAMGIMQLMPATAQGLGVSDAYDPYQNIMGGAKYIGQLLSRYDGDVSLALAAYNAGSGNVAKYGGIPPFAETQNYVSKVLGYYQNGVDIPSQTSSAQASATDTEGLSADERQNIYRQMLSLTNQLILDKLEA
jgi:soluble lytic murein transglycosylase-like protein